MEYPRVILNDYKYSDAERVKSLLEILYDLKYRPFNIDYVITYEQTLRSLDQYVTLIGFYGIDKEFGEVDIEESVRQMRKHHEDYVEWMKRRVMICSRISH